MSNISKQMKKILFMCICLIWSALSLIYCMVNGYESIYNYFIKGSTLSDFYTPMVKEIENTYGSPYFSNYPPLINLLFVVLRAITGVTVQQGNVIPNMAVYVCFAIFFIMFVSGIFLLGIKYLNEYEKSIWNYFVMFFILCSGAFLFLYQRGNILLLVIFLVGIFLENYESENNTRHNWAIICISIAIAIKIYPIIFVALFLIKRKWKDIMKTALFTGGFFIIPFGIYGYSTIFEFISNIFYRDTKINNVLNHAIGLKGSLKILSVYLFKHINSCSKYYTIAVILAGLMLGYIFYFSKYKWMKIAALVLAMAWMFNGSYLYNVCFFIYPLLLFFNENEKRRIDIIYLILFCNFFSIIILPDCININRILQIYSLGKISGGIMVVQISLIIFALTMFVDTVNYRKKETSIHVV